jgi:exopolysaccharide biosynthesis polyprenyl glycosylphosphotransferase
MTTLGELSSLPSSPLTRPAALPRHARTQADRQPAPGATLLAGVDAGVAVVSMIGLLIVTNADEMPLGLNNFLSIRVTLRNVLVLALLVAGWRLAFHACGLYTMRGVRSATGERLRVCLACAFGSAMAIVVPMLTLGDGVRPHELVYFFGIATIATLLVREGRRAIWRHREPRRVLIVGTGMRALGLWRRLASDETADYVLAGFVDTAGRIAATDEIAARCVGTLDDLEPLLMHHAIDEVCIALPIKSCYPDIQETIRVCERVGVRAKYQADLFESQVAWPCYDDPNSPTVTMHVVPSDYRLVVKRAVDVIGAVLALILLSPLMAAIAAAVRLTSPGPALFAQERYGYNRRRFRMLKFRTMLEDAEHLQAALENRNEADGPVFKITDDPRITPIGRLLRRTSLDELPQFFNVLRGEMSLVGPRPLPLRDVSRFTNGADMRRFSVRPGLTCLWQISGRSSLSFTDWIRLDLAYIDGWSLGLDLLILLRTVPAVVFGKGAR